MFGFVPRCLGYFVSHVDSPRLFKIRGTLGVSKFRLCWLSCLVFVFCRFPFKPSVRSYSFVIGSSHSALVPRVGLFIFAFLSSFRRCLWFSKVTEFCTQNMSTIKIYN